MDIGMEAGIFLVYAAGMFIVYFFGRMMLIPLKKIGRILLNSVIGGICLLAINVVGNAVGLSVPINVITAAITGILGLPGVAGLVVYFNWIV